MNTSLDDVRDKLIWVSDALIPKDPGNILPSAVEAGVVDTLISRALKARPSLEVSLREILARLPDAPPPDALQYLKDLGESDFEQLSHVIAGSYFLSEDVNRILRYPGQEAMPYDPDYDELMEIAQRVMDRGPIYLKAE